MSLRGRYIIDRVKRVVSSRITLPVPPYGDPGFWNSVYQSMETATAGMSPPSDGETLDDSFEWGGFDLQDVVEYDYKRIQIDQVDGNYAKSSHVVGDVQSSTLGKTLGVPPLAPAYDKMNLSETNSEESVPKEPIMMLGCGNSKLGEQMLDHGWRGPIVQVDIAAKALELIARRSRHDSSKLQFVQEDATHLSSFKSQSVHACLDKGLIDALFCANEYEQIRDIMKSTLRVLRPGGLFCIFSFSQPEFLLPQLVPLKDNQFYGRPNRGAWDDLEMQELERILLYRFQKSKANDNNYYGGFSEPKRKSPRKRQ